MGLLLRGIPLFMMIVSVHAYGCCSDDWEDYYNFPVIEVDQVGYNITLNCNDSTYPNNSYPVAWILPTFEILENGTSNNKYEMSADAMELTIFDTGTDDFGLYHCMMRYPDEDNSIEEWYLVKIGINTQGPYFEDLWEKYQTNTYIGIVAFFGFLFVCLCIWLIWHFRYIPPQEAFDETTYANDGFSPEIEDMEKEIKGENDQYPDIRNRIKTESIEADISITTML